MRTNGRFPQNRRGAVSSGFRFLMFSGLACEPLRAAIQGAANGVQARPLNEGLLFVEHQLIN